MYVLAVCRLWMQFSKSNILPVPSSNAVMITVSLVLYTTLLEHVATYQSSLTKDAQSEVSEMDVTRDGEDVYY